MSEPAPKVRSIDNNESLMTTWELVRQQIESGDVTSLAWAAGTREGDISCGFNLATRLANRYHLIGAVATLERIILDATPLEEAEPLGS